MTGFNMIESLIGYTTGTASGLKYLGISKKILNEKIAFIIKGIPGDITRLYLRIIESLCDKVLQVKKMKNREIKACYDKKVKAHEFKISDEVFLFDSMLLK